MFKILIPAVAALGLVAFAAKTQPVAAVEPVQASAETAMGWHVSHEGPTAKLAYGVANSDQLAMMVMCEPGQATAAVYGDVAPASARTDRAAKDAGINMGGMEEKHVGIRDASLSNLADKGAMTVVGTGGSFRVAATAQERRAIREFLDYCGRNRA